jgi:hypothetical protein
MTRGADNSTGAVAEPDERHRWRCGACGNLTRFDVVREATSREFWHVDLSGQGRVEESETVRSRIVALSCRWCGRGDVIEVVARPGAASP